MAETDRISEADRIECASLERAVSDVERTLLSYPLGTRPFFNAFLQNAKARLGFLETRIQEAEREQREHATNEVALVALANKERALNAQEKEAYSGFLKEDFFTKKDFGVLEQFYAKSWDRLSEGGKNQMSHRIWEGIRREEYAFSELPQWVREKEAKHAYMRLRDSTIGSADAARIPEQDRKDFIRAYESGKREDAEKILERESFKNGMFRGPESRSINHARVDTGRDAEGAVVGKRIAAGIVPDGAVPRTGKDAGNANLDLSDINLDGLKLTEGSSAPSSAEIPRGETAPAKSGPSLRSG